MKEFDIWNSLKKDTDKNEIRRNFSEREIWFIRMGVNVGYEQDGKGEDFLRPIIVLKKFNKHIFLGIPLTKTEKDMPFYHTFVFKGARSTAILSQVRLFDARRLKFRYGKISHHDFMEVKEKLTVLIQ